MKRTSIMPLFVVTCLVAALPLKAQAPSEVAEKATVCELLADRAKYNHKLVEVTGNASHGFEDSGFSDPSCGGRYGNIWFEYGGTAATGTMSTASGLDRTRPKTAVVEGIAVPLVEDDNFRQFDRLLHEGKGNMVRARVIGRFFAGRENNYGRVGLWGGFGHLGCCSLFMLQQVIAVETERRPDLDYSDERAQPKADCYRFLTPINNEEDIQRAQKEAESGVRSFAFNDPDRVAREEVLTHVGQANASIQLKRLSATPARIMYQASVAGSKTQYTITLSRPYWLSTVATDNSKVAWVVLATVATCDTKGEGPTVQRIH